MVCSEHQGLKGIHPMNTETPVVTLGKIARARSGQELVKFKDVLNNPCILQTVSTTYGVAGVGSIRIGLEKAAPKIQAQDAKALGLSTSQKTGLIKYEVPPEVRIETSVVLARNQVEDLVGLLIHWLNSGNLGGNPPTELTIAGLKQMKDLIDRSKKARKEYEQDISNANFGPSPSDAQFRDQALLTPNQPQPPGVERSDDSIDNDPDIK